MADSDTKTGQDTSHLERRGSDEVDALKAAQNQINQDQPDIYIEALTRYPNDESIDAGDEKRLVRKLDMRILPLLGICYFFYYVDKTTLYVGLPFPFFKQLGTRISQYVANKLRVVPMPPSLASKTRCI